MYLTNLILAFMASQAVEQTASSAAIDAETNTRPLPTKTRPFEIPTTTIFANGISPDKVNIDGAQLLPRGVCAKAIYSGKAISFQTINCPDTANCATPTACFCPGCCAKGAVCTGCPPSSVFLADGKLTTTCKTAETVVVTNEQAREIVPTTLSSLAGSITASLTEATSTPAVSESRPTPSASNQQSQAALQRGVVQPFAWFSRFVSSLSVRLVQALPIKIRESNAAGRVYGSFTRSETIQQTESQSAIETPPVSSPSGGSSYRERTIGDHKNNHQHKHRHLGARKLNTTTTTVTVTVDSANRTNSTSKSSTLPSSFTATTWFTTTSTSTATVFSTQAAAEPTNTCDLRRRRDL